MNIVSRYVHFYTELSEFFRNNTEMFNVRAFDRDIALGHSSQTNERAYFDHIRQHAMFGSGQVADSLYRYHIAANTADLCAHAVEHFAKLLHIRFAGGIIASS